MTDTPANPDDGKKPTRAVFLAALKRQKVQVSELARGKDGKTAVKSRLARIDDILACSPGGDGKPARVVLRDGQKLDVAL